MCNSDEPSLTTIVLELFIDLISVKQPPLSNIIAWGYRILW